MIYTKYLTLSRWAERPSTPPHVPTTGTEILTNTEPSGFVHTQTKSFNGLRKEFSDLTGEGGTTMDFAPDVRFPARLALVQQQDQSAGGGVISNKSEFTLTNSADPFSISTFTKTTTFESEGTFQKTVYNKAANSVTSTSPMGYKSVALLDSKSRVVSHQVASFIPVKYTYNTLGQLVKVVQGTRTSSFTYNAQGRLASSVNPMGYSTGFTYDSAGQLLTQTLPNGKAYKFGYNPNGELNSITNSAAQVYSYGFDANQNVVLNSEPVISATAYTKQWSYNADDQPTTTKFPDVSELKRVYNTNGTLASFTGVGVARSFTWTSGILNKISTSGNINLTLTGSGVAPIQTDTSVS